MSVRVGGRRLLRVWHRIGKLESKRQKIRHLQVSVGISAMGGVTIAMTVIIDRVSVTFSVSVNVRINVSESAGALICENFLV